jgi:hypothetical protein
VSQKQRAYATELKWAARPECRLRLTFDKSPVRERRTPGSVRGTRGNSRSYRDRHDFLRSVRSQYRKGIGINNLDIRDVATRQDARDLLHRLSARVVFIRNQQEALTAC